VVVVFLIIGGGALTFHIVEGWSYFDSLYFTVATFSTIGYGDIVPVTYIGKILVMVYAFLGVPLFVAITTLLMERRFKKFVFNHFAHHSKQLAQTERKLTKKLELTAKEIEDEAKKTQKQEQKIKKLEKEVKKEEGQNQGNKILSKTIISKGSFWKNWFKK
ncbi:MAG: hypothetical protein CR971_01355, partial [candidate division SR1 bacterium]